MSLKFLKVTERLCKMKIFVNLEQKGKEKEKQNDFPTLGNKCTAACQIQTECRQTCNVNFKRT